MRIQQLTKSDDGAVAVLTALLMFFVIIGISAFTVDFGGAFVVKRDVANGADAAALSAAKELSKNSGTCATIAINPASTLTAQTAADPYLTDNSPGAVRTNFNVACDVSQMNLLATYAGSNTSPRFFGGMFGTGDYTVTRMATASVGVAVDANGARPYMLCGTDLQALQVAQPSPVEIDYPSPICGNEGGNWYTVDCPTQTNNGGLDQTTALGCSSDITIIPGVPGVTDPTKIIQNLQKNCTALSADPGCLTANPGNVADSKVIAAWQTLLGQDILLPVFYPGSIKKSGNNTLYPVYAFAGVTVCGYSWGNGNGSPNKTARSTISACSSGVFTPSGNALFLKLTNVLTSGSTGASTCAIGNVTCDFGARTIRLVK